MEMAVKTTERAARSAGRRRCGESFPTAGIMRERRPLASLLHGFLGALPHGDGIHGGGKTWLWWLEIRGWRSPPRIRFPPFYISSRISVTPSRAAVKRAFPERPNSKWAEFYV